MRLVCGGILIIALVLLTLPVRAGEVDPEHFGTWAPVGKSCKSEPRIVVTAKEIIIHHQGRVQRFGDLDESYSCDGVENKSITTCVTPLWDHGNDVPFWLIFNPGQKRHQLDFSLLNGDPSFFPKDNMRFRHCTYQPR